MENLSSPVTGESPKPEPQPEPGPIIPSDSDSDDETTNTQDSDNEPSPEIPYPPVPKPIISVTLEEELAQLDTVISLAVCSDTDSKTFSFPRAMEAAERNDFNIKELKARWPDVRASHEGDLVGVWKELTSESLETIHIKWYQGNGLEIVSEIVTRMVARRANGPIDGDQFTAKGMPFRAAVVALLVNACGDDMHKMRSLSLVSFLLGIKVRPHFFPLQTSLQFPFNKCTCDFSQSFYHSPFSLFFSNPRRLMRRRLSSTSPANLRRSRPRR